MGKNGKRDKVIGVELQAILLSLAFVFTYSFKNVRSRALGCQVTFISLLRVRFETSLSHRRRDSRRRGVFIFPFVARKIVNVSLFSLIFEKFAMQVLVFESSSCS